MTEQEKRENVIKELGIVWDAFNHMEHELYADYVFDALALLKAQEPMKPVPAIDDVGDWLCGNCYQSVVGTEELDEGGFVPIRFNYCPNCGQAVKWE